jgi:hypothetical protein
MCRTIKHTLTNKTRKDTQLKFYKVMAVPTLLYGCETWLRFLRHAAEYARRDEINDLSIRSELQIFNINKITDKKKEWHGHIQRMDPCRIARIAVEYKPMGHRDVGRPKRRWEVDF